MAVVINTITNLEKLSLINNNFTKLAAAINESLVWRNGSTAGETSFTRDLDLNGYQILNAYVGEYSLSDVVEAAQGAGTSAAEAAASALQAAGYATSASASAESAAQSASSLSSSVAKLSRIVFPSDYSAAGDGVTDDTAAFSALESAVFGYEIDLDRKTYLVSAIPTLNKYHNGNFKVGSVTYPAKNVFSKDVNGVVLVGYSGQSFPDNYVMSPNLFTYRTGTFASGGALNSATKAAQTVAIGPDAMGNTSLSFENIAIGEVALQNVQSTTDAYSTATGADAGTRNIGIGGNSGQFMTNGRRNIFIGRNSGTGSVNVSETTAVGAGALFGYNVNGWYGYVENYIPNNNTSTTISAFGCNAAQLYAGTSVSTFGHASASNLKTGDANCFFGVGAGRDVEKNVGWNGYVRTDYGSGETVSYTKTGSNIVVTRASHSAVVGGTVYVLWNNDGPAFPNHGHAFRLPVTAVTTDTFTVSCPYTANGSGTAVLYWSTSTTLDTASRHNVYIGHNAGLTNPVSQNSTVIGSLACQLVSTSISNSVVVGMNSGQNLTNAVSGLTVLGYNALRNNTSTATNTTAIGVQAGLLMQDGSTPSISVNNSTMLGANSRVSANNQVQLGDSSTTTYVYGTVQNRSDMRDKADWRDPEYSLDFVRGLRAREYKWDMREDYLEVSEDGSVTRLEKDGSKKRNRFHSGYLAQEVQELCEKLGVDFGGLQDHTITGGCDVLSLGYDEFIPHIQKAVAMAWDKLDEMDARISALEGKETDG